MAAVGGAVGVRALLGGEITAVDGRVAVLAQLGECGDVEKVGRSAHRTDHGPQNSVLVSV